MDAFDKVKNYDIEEVSIKLLLPFKFSEKLSDVSNQIEQLALANLAQSLLLSRLEYIGVFNKVGTVHDAQKKARQPKLSSFFDV